MGFWGKVSKITGFSMLGVGLAGTAGFGALLGVGANAKYDMNKILEINISGGIPPGFPKMEAGIGSLNYGEYYIDGQYWETYIDSLMIPQATKDELKKQIKAALSLSLQGSYSESVTNARKAKKDLEEEIKLLPSGDPNTEQTIKEYNLIIDLYGSIISAYDEMVAGAVLLTIFMLVAITSVPLLIIGKKKA